MKEISLNILDVAENSVKAQATLTEILIDETPDTLTLIIRDDGTGMDRQTVESVTDPFFTTRTTRKVGMGVPFLKLAAQQTDGSFSVESSVKEENHGTTVKAVFNKNHLDYTPLGDIVSSIVTLIQGHPDTDFYFSHKKGESEITLDTRELRQVLEGVPLNSYEVIKWIEEYLKEQYSEIR